MFNPGVTVNEGRLVVTGSPSTIARQRLMSDVGRGEPRSLATPFVTLPPDRPVNDDFANAISIVLGETVTGTTVHSTADAGDLRADFDWSIGWANEGSVWWKYEALANSNVTLTVFPSDAPLIAFIRSGTTLEDLAFVDFANASVEDVTGWVTFTAVAGTTYYLHVSGLDGIDGEVTFSAEAVDTRTAVLRYDTIRYDGSILPNQGTAGSVWDLPVDPEYSRLAGYLDTSVDDLDLLGGLRGDHPFSWVVAVGESIDHAYSPSVWINFEIYGGTYALVADFYIDANTGVHVMLGTSDNDIIDYVDLAGGTPLSTWIMQFDPVSSLAELYCDNVLMLSVPGPSYVAGMNDNTDPYEVVVNVQSGLSDTIPGTELGPGDPWDALSGFMVTRCWMTPDERQYWADLYYWDSTRITGEGGSDWRTTAPLLVSGVEETGITPAGQYYEYRWYKVVVEETSSVTLAITGASPYPTVFLRTENPLSGDSPTVPVTGGDTFIAEPGTTYYVGIISPYPGNYHVAYTLVATIVTMGDGNATPAAVELTPVVAAPTLGGVATASPAAVARSVTIPLPILQQTYTYTGSMQSITVPAGVTTATMTVTGAVGNNWGTGSVGGWGGRVGAEFNVVAGTVYDLYVGGFNGYPNGGVSTTGFGSPEYGGGATYITTSGGTLATALIVAGGGGGGGGSTGTMVGGIGGYPAGTAGDTAAADHLAGGGGTATTAGAGTGGAGNGDVVAVGNGGGSAFPGGAGGGGWHGGGGAGYGGGGGGSGYVAAGGTAITYTDGASSSNGRVVIGWNRANVDNGTATPSAVACSAVTPSPTAAGIVAHLTMPVIKTWDYQLSNPNSAFLQPPGCVAGDLVLIQEFSTQGGASYPNLTAGGQTLTEHAHETYTDPTSGDVHGFGTYWFVYNGATWINPGSQHQSGGMAQIIVVTGGTFDATAPIDAYAFAFVAAGSTMTIPALTTPYNNDMRVLFAITMSDYGSYAPPGTLDCPASFTSRFDAPNHNATAHSGVGASLAQPTAGLAAAATVASATPTKPMYAIHLAIAGSAIAVALPAAVARAATVPAPTARGSATVTPATVTASAVTPAPTTTGSSPAADGQALLLTMSGWWDATDYSGSGDLLNKGTVGSANMVITGSVPFTTDRFTFPGTAGNYMRGSNNAAFDPPSTVGDWSVGIVMANLTPFPAGVMLAKRDIAVSFKGWEVSCASGADRKNNFGWAVSGSGHNGPTDLVGGKSLRTTILTAGAFKQYLGTTAGSGSLAIGSNPANAAILEFGDSYWSGGAWSPLKFELYGVFIYQGALTAQNLTDIAAYYGI